MKKITALLIFFSIYCSVQASHVYGGEIYYNESKTTANSYDIHLILYHELGTILPTATKTIDLTQLGSSTSTSVTLNFVLGTEDTIISSCSRTIVGYHYTSTINLGMPTTSSIYDIGYDYGFRQQNLAVNVNDPIGFGMYLNARINHNVGGSSPRFLNTPHYSGLSSTTQYFDNAAFDPDEGDSISVSFENYFDVLHYETNYSSTHPFGTSVTASIDPHTGLIEVANAPIGVYIVPVVVKSYTNGVLSSEIIRDLPIHIDAMGSNSMDLQLQNIQGTSLSSQSGRNYYFEMYEGDLLQFDLNTTSNSVTSQPMVTLKGFGEILTNNQSATGNCVGANCAQFNPVNGGFSMPGFASSHFVFNPDTSFVSANLNATHHYFSFTGSNIDSCNVERQSVIGVYIKVKRAQSTYSTSVYKSCYGTGVYAQIYGDTANLSWSPTHGVSNVNSANALLDPDSNIVYTVTNNNTGLSFKIHVLVDSLGISGFTLNHTGGSIYVPQIIPSQMQSIYYNGLLLTTNDSVQTVLNGSYWATITSGVCTAYSDTIIVSLPNIAVNSSTTGNAILTNTNLSSFDFELTDTYSNELENVSVILPNLDSGVTTMVEISLYQGSTVLKTITASTVDNYIFTASSIDEMLNPGVVYRLAVSTNQNQMVLFKPNALPFTDSQGLINIKAGHYLDTNGTVTSGSYPYMELTFKSAISVEENSLNVKTYPNPVRENLTIDLAGESTVTVFDISGKEVLKTDIQGKTLVYTGDLNDGLYLIEIANNQGVYRSKFLKQ